jgi:hypothetical protein
MALLGFITTSHGERRYDQYAKVGDITGVDADEGFIHFNIEYYASQEERDHNVGPYDTMNLCVPYDPEGPDDIIQCYEGIKTHAPYDEHEDV